LNYEQVGLVQQTWAKLKPVFIPAAVLFYSRAFKINSSTRDLFENEMHYQGELMMGMIDVVVASLVETDLNVPVVQNLGNRHVGYVMKGQHYASAASAFLWTLNKLIGEEFTP